MQIKLHHIPVDQVGDLRDAFEAGNLMYCIQRWNECAVTSDRLCFCPSGVETLKLNLPKLWSNQSEQSANEATQQSVTN